MNFVGIPHTLGIYRIFLGVDMRRYYLFTVSI